MAALATQVMTPLADDAQVLASDSASNKTNGCQVDPQKDTDNLTTESTEQSPSDGGKDHDLQRLHERLAAIDNKLSVVNTVPDLRRGAMKLGRPGQEVSRDDLTIESMNMNELPVYYEAHLDFYWDAMRLMRRARDSHDMLVKIKKTMKDKRDAEVLAKSKSLTEKETEASGKLSAEAFLKGEKANVVRVDWAVATDYAGLTVEELVVMTYRVFGFVLRSRKWAQLDLTFLRYQNADARSVSINAFERLELPAGHRKMVKSLVIQHFRSRQTAFTKDEQTDLIKGKGHLGTTAREMEEELEKNFALVSRWGCILLLDEADVFLSARERMDFKRNGLVAVFLRVLEYYTGILFLTTNRIGDIDEAFASRVHMSLYYPELDETKILKVFELNLDLIRDRFKKQGREIIFDASSIEGFAKQHFTQHKYSLWNGRQIRNLCQTALALAEFDAQGGELDAEIDRSIPVSLQLKHFKTVQIAYLSFGEYLGDIRGTRDDRRAIDYGLRARQDTPYQTRSSRLAQKAEEMTSQELHGHGSDASHYRGASQGDPFQPCNQRHMQPNQGTNASPQAYRQSQQPQMTPMGNMGFGMSGQLG
ncbi:hypothetical protein ACHAPT_009779 [Fusarium lateritium]